MWDFVFGMVIGLLPDKVAWGCLILGLVVLTPIVLWILLR